MLKMRRIVSALTARRQSAPGLGATLALFLAITSASAQPCPERLRVAFPDASAEPFVRGQGDAFVEPPGLLVSWLREAARKLGCPLELVRLPTRRVRAMLDAGQIDLVAGVVAGGPLGTLLALPAPEGARQEFDLSIGIVEYALYARRSDAPVWTGQQLALAPGQIVGTAQSSRAEAIAQEHAWPTELAPSHESALQKLLAGRTAALLVHSYFLDERLAREPALAAQLVKLLPVIERRRLQVGVARPLAERDPAFAQRLWRALCRESQAAQAEGACRMPGAAPATAPRR